MLRSIQNADLYAKKVLCRLDLNVPILHGKIQDSTRIQKIIPTIEFLREKQAKIILLSHFGRPKGTFVRDLSLAPITDALYTALGETSSISFALDCVGKPAKEAIESMHNGDIVLLENVRFHAGEETNHPKFSDALAALADLYVNDAFACSHRSHASITGIAKRLPAYAGLLLQSELEALSNLLSHPKKPVIAIIGGAKISTKISLLRSLIKQVDAVVIGGAMANTFLKVKGFSIGSSLYEEALMREASDIMCLADKHQTTLILPEDVMVAPSIEAASN